MITKKPLDEIFERFFICTVLVLLFIFLNYSQDTRNPDNE